MNLEPLQPLEEGRGSSKQTRISDVSYKSTSSQARVTVDNNYLDKLVCLVKKKRGRALVNEEKLDILLRQGYLWLEHEAKKKKVGHGQSIRTHAVSKTTMKMLKQKTELVEQTWKEYVTDIKVFIMNNSGNRIKTCLCTSRVQAFIQEKRVKQECVVAQDILEVLVQEGLANYDLDDQKSNAAGLHTTLRFLKENVYRRGQKKAHNITL